MCNNSREGTLFKRLSLLLFILCIPMAYVGGQGTNNDANDAFVDGALAYYRHEVIKTEAVLEYKTFYFMGYVDSFFFTQRLYGIFPVGKNNGIRYEVVSRYVLDHPESIDFSPTNLILSAITEKWPEYSKETLEFFDKVLRLNE